MIRVFLCHDVSQATEVEETLKRIQSHRGVEGVLIINHDGIALKSTLSADETSKYASEMARVSLCHGIEVILY